ncbi:BAHD acyltransferase DCR [Hibiscus syriacus]|uniref:BAHD acyltransferase DCR n=1 Tax=Hibiscus syriacus TaxID=106335 RepID=A0A6A2XRR7_HIBSY|nr:BAHD acyltransferase DCR [Hibiscus syriacus]
MGAGAVNKEEEVSKVKITGKTHVKPGNIIGRKQCQLITFDLPYLAFYYNQKLLFYKCEGFEEKVEKLKDGLRVVLEEFYQLAGKLGKDEEGVFRVEHDDDMDGVEVLEAAAEGIAVDELEADEGTSSLRDLIPYNGVLNLEGLHRPLLSVQLTKLKDGVAMGCAFNHALLCHRSSSGPKPETRVKLDLSLPPNPIAASNGGAHQLREKLFRFPEASIDKIKSKANSNPPSPASKPFSTFQSLAVHIWQHVTKARNLKPEDYTVFTVFADCRKRVDPPMPESYFGNLIQAIFTVTAAGPLLANPLDFGALVIQKAIEAHDAKAIEERNKQWEAAPKIFEFKDAGVNCVAVGSSPRFKVYDVDFGWGKPEGVRTGSNNRFDGMVYLYQGKSGGRSIDVEITLEAGAMEQLEKEKTFSWKSSFFFLLLLQKGAIFTFILII